MSLTVTQGVAIAGYFQNTIGGGVEPEQKIIKRLTTEQRNICYQAFKVVARATQKDLNVPEQDPLDENVVTEIKTSLNEPLAGEEPEDRAWYAKPFYFIAHKISSLAKGFANIFWRVGSGALSKKAIAYRDDVVNSEKELNSYWYKTETDEGKKISLYEYIKKEIEDAQGNYHVQDEAVEKLEFVYGIFEDINSLAYLENLKKIRAERVNLSNEACSYLEYNNLKIKALSDIVLEAVGKPRSELEIDIFGSLVELATKIKTDNKNEKKLKLENLDTEHASFLAKQKPFKDQVEEGRKLVKELAIQGEVELGELRHNDLKETQNYWEKRQVKSGTVEEQQEKFDIEYRKELSQMKERYRSQEDETHKKIKEKQKEVDLAVEEMKETYHTQLGSEHEKYYQARRKVKNEVENRAKAKAENKLIAEEIQIAIEKLHAKYKPMIAERGT
ncbi:MAG TPA: hypothetical protein VIH61_06355, partial [Waddliaceae bacterium]